MIDDVKKKVSDTNQDMMHESEAPIAEAAPGTEEAAPEIKAPNFWKQFVYAVIPTKYTELMKVSKKALIGFIFVLAWLESFFLVIGSTIETAMDLEYRHPLGEWIELMVMFLGISFVYCIIRPILHVIFAVLEGWLPGLLVSWIAKRKCSLSDLFKASLYAGTLTAYINCVVSLIPVDIDIPFWIMTIIDIIIMAVAVFFLPKKSPKTGGGPENAEDTGEKEVADVQESRDETETGETEASLKVKEPNFLMQLLYSMLPGKYGKLANVGIKNFILFILLESLIGSIAAYIGILYNEIISKGLLDKASEWFVIIGFSIPVCLFMTVLLAVVNAVVSFFKGMPLAVLISWLSKQKCSLFDMYKATIYSQTPVYIASVCSLVVPQNMTWLLLLSWVISFFILLFGIFHLPRKPFFPGMDE